MNFDFATHAEELVYRLREYPPRAWNELYEALDRIERKYGLQKKLTEEVRQAIKDRRDR